MIPGNARHEDHQSYLATKPKRIALAAKDTPLTNALGIPRLSSEAPIVSASSIVKSLAALRAQNFSHGARTCIVDMLTGASIDGRLQFTHCYMTNLERKVNAALSVRRVMES